MVRAVKLENTPSGTYFNPSQGVFANVSSGSVSGGSIPLTINRNGSQINISFPSVIGGIYILERTTDFRNWNSVSTVTAVGVLTSVLQDNSNTSGFYRARKL